MFTVRPYKELVTQFLNRAKDEGTDCVRLFTDTLASWEFYEKRGF